MIIDQSFKISSVENKCFRSNKLYEIAQLYLLKRKKQQTSEQNVKISSNLLYSKDRYEDTIIHQIQQTIILIIHDIPHFYSQF